MEAYTGFAELYDEFMEETPYDVWCDNLVKVLHSNGIDDGLVCELGAGTGKMTRRLANKGYDMIGIDNSGEMLSIAMEKEKEDSSILYLNQDMREFELYGTVRAIVSVCDSINYITDLDDLVTVFELCNNYLDPKGILLFDFNTYFKYNEIGDSTIAENKEDASFIWENWFDADTSINEYDITFFAKTESGLYQRFEETHVQRGYTLSEIKEALSKAGLVFVEAFDVETMKAPTETSERVYVVARESGK